MCLQGNGGGGGGGGEEGPEEDTLVSPPKTRDITLLGIYVPKYAVCI